MDPRVLGGSWVVIKGAISRVTIIITHIRGLITPVITAHEPPSKAFTSELSRFSVGGLHLSSCHLPTDRRRCQSLSSAAAEHLGFIGVSGKTVRVSEVIAARV